MLLSVTGMSATLDDAHGHMTSARRVSSHRRRSSDNVAPSSVNSAKTSATGHVVKEGKRELSDMSFQMRLTINRDDPLRHEKALLDDWVRADLPPAKKK